MYRNIFAGVLIAGVFLFCSCASIRRSWNDRAPAWKVTAKHGDLRVVQLLFRPDLDEVDQQPGAVYVVGDFNGWTAPGKGGGGRILQMEYDKKDRYWKIKLVLNTGIYRYFYLLDGRERVADMKSAETRADGSVFTRMVLY